MSNDIFGLNTAGLAEDTDRKVYALGGNITGLINKLSGMADGLDRYLREMTAFFLPVAKDWLEPIARIVDGNEIGTKITEILDSGRDKDDIVAYLEEYKRNLLKYVHDVQNRVGKAKKDTDLCSKYEEGSPTRQGIIKSQKGVGAGIDDLLNDKMLLGISGNLEKISSAKKRRDYMDGDMSYVFSSLDFPNRHLSSIFTDCGTTQGYLAHAFDTMINEIRGETLV